MSSPALEVENSRLYTSPMVIKLLFLAIVLYFVVKTVRSLINAVTNDGGKSEPLAVPRPNGSRADVEDAKYVDIEEKVR